MAEEAVETVEEEVVEEDVGAEAPPMESVFDKLRERVQAGETVFGDADEEAEDAEEESDATGDEGAEAEAGDVDDEAEGAQEEAGEEVEEEEAPDAEDEGGEGAGDDGIQVALPGRNAGEEVGFVVETQQEADDLRRLANGYMRGEDARAAAATVQTDKDEIALIDAAMEADPAGFILDKVATKSRVEVVKALLLDPEVTKALQEDEEWADDMDDGERELARLRSEKARRETREKVETVQRAKASARVHVSRITDTITGMVPEGAAPEDAVAFQKAALDVAEAECNRLKRLNISEDELVSALNGNRLLKPLMEQMGAAPSSEAGAGKGPKKTTPAKAGGKKGKAPDPAGKLKKGRARRRAVASAPAGVGTPPASIELPKNQSVTERIKTARKMGIGNILSGKG